MTPQGSATPDMQWQPPAARSTVRRTWRWAVLLLALAMLAPGCRIRLGGETTTAAENYRLAQEVNQLQRQVDQLENRLELSRGEAESLRQQLAAARNGPAIDGVEAPMLSRLRFGRHTGPVDVEGDDRDDLIRIYLHPQDQRGRLLPVAGRASVRAVVIPEEGQPQTVAERVYEPAEFDRAWRDAFTGTHYTLELPLPDTLSEGATELTVQVIFLEASTGTRLTQQQVMTVRR